MFLFLWLLHLFSSGLRKPPGRDARKTQVDKLLCSILIFLLVKEPGLGIRFNVSLSDAASPLPTKLLALSREFTSFSAKWVHFLLAKTPSSSNSCWQSFSGLPSHLRATANQILRELVLPSSPLTLLPCTQTHQAQSHSACYYLLSFNLWCSGLTATYSESFDLPKLLKHPIHSLSDYPVLFAYQLLAKPWKDPKYLFSCLLSFFPTIKEVPAE